MRLASVTYQGKSRVGIVDGETIHLAPADTGDMVDLIVRGRPPLDIAFRENVALAKVAVGAPIQRFRRDILCTGWNYWAHFEESRGKRDGQDVEKPAAPTFFTKGPNTVIGPTDPIGWDPYISAKWDFEAELGLVIGRRCRSIPKAEALNYVFGYFLVNDVSQRDLQRRHGGQWLKGKSIDGTMPMGPYLVTPDELDIPNIQIETLLNGAVMQSAFVRQMAFAIPELIAELSFGMTLEPGDVLITGTPAGIGAAREPPVFLKAGDEIVVRATGLGELRNHLVAANLHGATDVADMSAPK